MNQSPAFIQMPQRKHLRRHLKIAEPIHSLRHRATLRRIDLQLVKIRTTPTRQHKRSRMPFKLQMLHIVIMSSEIHVNLMLSQQRLPITNQHLMIPMRSIRKNRMMPHRHQKRRSPRLLQFRRQPRQLLRLLRRSQRKVRPAVPRPIRKRHIAIERNHRHQWLLRRKLKPIPQRRHRP